jgi:hypothetical protein
MERTGRHAYITGNAGTGKSTQLQYFKEKTQKEFIVLAPMGVAAINVGGATIHSFFRFPPRLATEEAVRRMRGKGKSTYWGLTPIVDYQRQRAPYHAGLCMGGHGRYGSNTNLKKRFRVR